MVLLQLAAGKEKLVISRVARVKGVKKVSGVFGSWDAVAEVQANNIETLAKVICSRIRKIKGVSNTETLIEVKL